MTARPGIAAGRRLPVRIVISIAARGWPPASALRALARDCVAAALAEAPIAKTPRPPELSVVFSADAAVRDLNARWRGMDKPTNVLSFPAFPWSGQGAPPPMLGDIVLARETVAREAEEQGKAFDDHLAHLVVHGFLHLIGHDHENDAEAEAMEAVERRALARLAIADPYALSRDDG